MSERIGTDKTRSTAGAVNPEFHHEFEALCALYSSGDLTEEEWALLQIHMGYCDSCHEKFLQYQRITEDLIPALAAAAAERGEGAGESRAGRQPESRLVSASDSTAARPSQPSLRTGWKLPLLLLAACAAGLACLFAVRSLRSHEFRQYAAVRPVPNSAIPPPPGGVAAAAQRELKRQLEQDQAHIDSLERNLKTAESSLRATDAREVLLRKDLQNEEASRKELSDQKDALTEQLVNIQNELAEARNRLTAAGADAAEQTTRRDVLEARVRELEASLEERDIALSEKDRMLSLDKEFLAHDRDIRDLIGARNLYIADIFDTKENGKTAKQFGRIFYTRDRSLIFYGFDLDSQAGRRQNVSFQAWGSTSGKASPISLGLFYQDSSHKRWVLRCNDPKTLARLDMVFVTVEPPGGSNRPTGKPLLRAYLQIHPNHP